MTEVNEQPNGLCGFAVVGAIPAVGFALMIIVLAFGFPQPDGVLPALVTMAAAVLLVSTVAAVVTWRSGCVAHNVRLVTALTMAVVLGVTIAIPQSMAALNAPWWGYTALPMGLGELLILAALAVTLACPRSTRQPSPSSVDLTDGG